MSGQPAPARADLASFAWRVLVIVIIVGGLLALWRLRDALSVAFGSIVLAVSALGMAEAIERRTRLSRGAALAMVFGGGALVMVIALAVFGATIAAQFDELGRKLPEGLRMLEVRAKASPLGAEAVERLREAAFANGAGNLPRIASYIVGAIGSVLTYGVIMLFGAVFLALEPDRYRRGVMLLIPPGSRPRSEAVFDRIAVALQRWMISRLAVMVAVGVMSSLALWALGIDAPFALGLTGAILTFIPHIGSVMSVIPAALIGFLQHPAMAAYVVVVFWLVHFIEGTFITPYAQDEAVDVPPVVSIFSTLVFTVLLGPVGVLLAGPLTVVLFVAVRALYLEDVLGEPHANPPLKGFRKMMQLARERRAQHAARPGNS